MKKYLLPYQDFNGYNVDNFHYEGYGMMKYFLGRKGFINDHYWCAIHIGKDNEYIGVHYEIIHISKNLDEVKYELDKYMIDQGYVLLNEDQVIRMRVLL
jgi:hypothetical protein